MTTRIKAKTAKVKGEQMTLTCKIPPRHIWEAFARKYFKEYKQWKALALVYKNIIQRSQNRLPLCPHVALAILHGANKIANISGSDEDAEASSYFENALNTYQAAIIKKIKAAI